MMALHESIPYILLRTIWCDVHVHAYSRPLVSALIEPCAEPPLQIRAPHDLILHHMQIHVLRSLLLLLNFSLLLHHDF